MTTITAGELTSAHAGQMLRRTGEGVPVRERGRSRRIVSVEPKNAHVVVRLSGAHGGTETIALAPTSEVAVTA